jgi:hypothetical protein
MCTWKLELECDINVVVCMVVLCDQYVGVRSCLSYFCCLKF